MGRDETSGPVFVMGLALQDRQREEGLDSPGMITASEGVTETVPLVTTSQASDPRGRDGEAAHVTHRCAGSLRAGLGSDGPREPSRRPCTVSGAASGSLAPDEDSRGPLSVMDTRTHV